MIRSNLSDYSGVYIHVKGTMTVTNTAAQGAAANDRNKGIIFKNCAPLINCISRINNTQIDEAHDIDVVMHMYNLFEYIDIYSKISGILWQYYKDEPDLNNNNVIINFSADDNNSNLFKFKQKITGQTNNDVTVIFGERLECH